MGSSVRNIDMEEFLDRLNAGRETGDYEFKEGLNRGPVDFLVTEEGVSAVVPDLEEREALALFPAEARALREFARECELRLPCSDDELQAWAVNVLGFELEPLGDDGAAGIDPQGTESVIRTRAQAQKTIAARWAPLTNAKEKLRREAETIIRGQRRTGLNHAEITRVLIEYASHDDAHPVKKLQIAMLKSGLLRPDEGQGKAVEKAVRRIVKEACESLDRHDLIVGSPRYREPA